MRQQFRTFPRVLVMIVAVALNVAAADAKSQDEAAPRQRAAAPSPRPSVSTPSGRYAPNGWIVHIDNDLFAFTDDDRDYTAGVAVTLGGGDDAGPAPLRAALDWLDARTGIGSSTTLKRHGEGHDDPSGSAGPGARRHRAFTVGVQMFTPRDLVESGPIRDDRPYANLSYVSMAKLTHDPLSNTAFKSSLTLGVLGLPVVERLHRTVHGALGGDRPMGYAHQIAEGGEPTARYAVKRYRLLTARTRLGRPLIVRLGLGGSMGYLTEASAELAVRYGVTEAPWWASTPAEAGDFEAHVPGPRRTAPPSSRIRAHLSAGLTVRARAYNAFLQGQFRTSAVTHSSERLNPLLFEAWIGATTRLPGGLSISYTIRHQTPELRDGPGARAFTWASIGIARRF